MGKNGSGKSTFAKVSDFLLLFQDLMIMLLDFTDSLYF